MRNDLDDVWEVNKAGVRLIGDNGLWIRKKQKGCRTAKYTPPRKSTPYPARKGQN